jgi:tRNA(adenine34) deaminase
MKQALLEAQQAFEEGEIPVGAIIVCQGKIIARAHNMTERLNDVTAHAEMQAITIAAHVLGGKYLINCTLYVTLEPCLMCAGALSWSQIDRIVYGATDEKRGYHLTGSSVFHPKTKITSGVLADESAALMRTFFKNKR